MTTKLEIEIPADQLDTITSAFLAGETVPYAYEILGGEEFRRIIGVDMDDPVDLDEVSPDEAFELVHACVRQFIRQTVARGLAVTAQRRAHDVSAAAAAALL